MKRWQQIILGILSFWPVVFLIVTSALAYSMSTRVPPIIPPFSWYGIILTIFTGFIVWGLVIGYIVHASRNEAISDSCRKKWILALFICNIFAMPIYWHIYITNGRKHRIQNEQGGE
ncbi:MAG: hypothetical protein ABFD64_12945 [Armatimonadota bacterium]